MARSKKANSYAIAIYEISKELKCVNEVKNDAISLLEVFENNPKMIVFLSRNKISHEKRKDFLLNVFGKKISKPLINTLKLLVDKNKSYMIEEILKQTIYKCNIELGIIQGIAYTTIKIPKQELEKIEEKLSKKIGKKIQLTNTINKFIIGGIKVIIGDKVWDHTIVNKINLLTESIKNKELL